MRYAVLALSALLIGACATSPKVDQEQLKTLPTGEHQALASIPKSALGPQELAPGECGLFLWSKTDVTKFIFFSKAISGTALISRADGPETLTQTNAGGEIFGQFNTSMAYSGSTGVQVALKMLPGDNLEGGQRVESGLITTTDIKGWQTKLPILGVQACKPE